MVGRNIKATRIAAGMSQEELAARMAVDQGYISSLGAGRRNPTVLTIWHACAALGILPDVLFRMEDGAKPPTDEQQVR